MAIGFKSCLIGAVLCVLPAQAQSIKRDNTELKKSCEPGDEVIDTLPAGASVEIRSGIQDCYFVQIKYQGKSWYGFLPGDAINGVERMDEERRAAPSIGAGAARLGPPPVATPENASPNVNKAVQLLSENQPQQALELLEAEAKMSPKDAKLLALAGLAAYRADELVLAVNFLKDSLDLEKNQGLESLYKKILKEYGTGRLMKTLIGSRAQLKYTPGSISEGDAHGLLTLIDREYTRISEELGCNNKERITAIAQNPIEYQRATDAAEWSVGQFDGRIRVSLMEQGKVGEETRQTFSHEIVHACLANLGSWPAWLHEGLAQKLSGRQLSPAAKQHVQEAARTNSLPKLNRMSQTWSRMSAEHATLAYAAALAAVDAFYDKFKELGIRNLLRNPDQLPQIADQLDKLLR